MKLPNAWRAAVPREKIVNYLLSPVHPVGKHKNRWLSRIGFKASAWQILAGALKTHAIANDIVRTEETSFGTRYIKEGELESPTGSQFVRCVWFIDTGREDARFVTAHPLRRKRT